MEFLGNTDILKLHKTAFLCSQKCSADTVLKSYDWAKEQREKGHCVVCGNHSQIEKDVFEILLKGKQPLILVLARGMQKVWATEVEKAVKDNSLLICTPFNRDVKRITRITAEKRNEKIIEISDSIMVGFVSDGGQLDRLLKDKEYKRI